MISNFTLKGNKIVLKNTGEYFCALGDFEYNIGDKLYEFAIMDNKEFEKLNIKRGELAYQHLNINNLETRTGYLLHWGHRKFRWLFWKQSYYLLLITKGAKTAVMDSFRLAFLFCKKITINFFKRNYKKIVAG